MPSETAGRIGVLGGTFNPVHLGHLLLAQSALESFELGRVFFIPCNRPPHKDVSGLLPAPHRLAMLELAVEEHLPFQVSDLEIRRGGPSFTIDTVKELRTLHPRAELFFIIGADSLVELHLWKKAEELLSLCTFVSFGRPGCRVRPEALNPADLRLPAPWPERLLANYRPGRPVGISSSDIRHRVAEGMSIRYLVPRAVEIYIAEHGLYRGCG